MGRVFLGYTPHWHGEGDWILFRRPPTLVSGALKGTEGQFWVRSFSLRHWKSTAGREITQQQGALTRGWKEVPDDLHVMA